MRIILMLVCAVAVAAVGFSTVAVEGADGPARAARAAPQSVFQGHPSDPSEAVNAPAPGARLIEPLFAFQLRDTSIAVDGDGVFWLTGTQREHRAESGLWLWRSADGRDWKPLGVVFDDGDRYFAPEIHFVAGRAVIVARGMGGGIKVLRSASGRGEGPWQLVTADVLEGRELPAEDPSLFEDDDGVVYLIWGDGYLARLSPELDRVVGEVRRLRPAPEHFAELAILPAREWPVEHRVGAGGAFVAKIDGKYHLFANEITGRMLAPTDDVFVAVADRLEGPYSPRYFCLPHAGQTTVFRHPDGRWMASFTGHLADHYAAFRERPGMVPLERSPEGRLRPAGSVRVERSPVAGLQPVLDEEIRDPSVTLGGDGYYYLTGTPAGRGYSNPTGGVLLWRSPDLVDWEARGFAWKWTELNFEVPKGCALWAPEIRYVKSDATFYLTYSIYNWNAPAGTPRGHSVLGRSVSGKAEGPYENVTKDYFVEGIDGFIFEDDDGSVYYLWGGGKLGKLNGARDGFEGEPVQLLTTERYRVGYEGNSMMKVGGTYILCGADWNGPLRREGTYDMMFATAQDIRGPYTAAQLGVPHAGHGTVFQAKDGSWYTTMFGNDTTAPFRRRFGLVPLDTRIPERLTARVVGE